MVISNIRSWIKTKKGQELLHKVFGLTFLSIIILIILLPLFWMLSTSLKGRAQTFIFPPQWIPEPIEWGNYPKALTVMPFYIYLKNTITITLGNVIGSVLSCSLVAYGFARLRFRGRNVLFIIMLSTLMIPYQVTLIPMFILFQKIGWVNTFKPLIVPAFFGDPFLIFLLRQYFMSIPRELDDAARIDGCNNFQIFYKIILPNCKPALVLVVVFKFIWTWNDFLAPLIYLNDASKYTLSIGLASFQGRFFTDWNLMMAASLAVMLPCLVVFFFGQKQLIEGISSVGIKG